ncbi:MAG: hypothetical protein M1281_00120 [Chloroflexi bacterium]|nr:hypothetical protein [Chloroflexota bacterium]
MDSKQTQALNRLVKKLNAMRATLKKDERDLLDDMILSRTAMSDEVAAHAMSKERVTPKITPAPDERIASRIAAQDEEVVAHAMTPQAEPQISKRIDLRIDYRITLDNEQGTYRIDY